MMLKCGSHRARDKVFGLLSPRVARYSFTRSTGKGVYPCTLEEFERVKHIKGVTKFRDGPDLLGCWS